MNPDAGVVDKRRFNAQLLRDNVLRQNAEMSAAVPAARRSASDSLRFVVAGQTTALPDPFVAAAARYGAAADPAGKGAADAAAEGKTAKEGERAIAQALLAQAQETTPGTPDGGLKDALNNTFGNGGGFRLTSSRTGTGMSSGIYRSFDAPHMKNSLLEKTGALKNAAQAAAVSNPLAKGSPRVWVAARQISAAARTGAYASRLRQMSALMTANRGGQAERPAAAMTAAWDASAAPNGIIQGGAASPAGAPAAAPASTPQTGESGPIANDSETAAPAPAAVPDVPSDHNVTPYQWAIDLAKILLVVILVLSIVIEVCRDGILTEEAVAALEAIVAVCGALLAALGIYMMAAMGQTMQGLMYTAIGAIVCALALAGPEATQGGMLATAWPIAAAILSLIGLSEKN